MRDALRAHSLEAVQTLVAIMRQGKPDTARVAAAQALLDRTWGRPAQAMRVNLEGPQPIYVFPPGTDPTLPDEQLAELAARAGQDADDSGEILVERPT